LNAGLRGNTFDFREALLHFLVEGCRSDALFEALADCTAISRMRLQVVRHFTEGALSRLRQRDTVVRVTNRLVEAADLRGEAIRDRETSSVVFGAVDAQTG